MKSALKKLIVKLLPLGLRKYLAIGINRLPLLDTVDRAYWATELLGDYSKRDANGYHKFLWTHHLGYARTYEVDERYGFTNFNESRRIFFDELPAQLAKCGVRSATDVGSVLEVGCSLGYLLRYMETDVFSAARNIVGVDVDAHAITKGKETLAAVGSKVRLHECDVQNLDFALSKERFDFILASGVLLYFDEDTASEIVRMLVARCGKVLAITGLAHATIDNKSLNNSELRERDGTWIHNIDRMLEAAGATVLARRWDGNHIVDGNTIYFLYATPGETK